MRLVWLWQMNTRARWVLRAVSISTGRAGTVKNLHRSSHAGQLSRGVRHFSAFFFFFQYSPAIKKLHETTLSISLSLSHDLSLFFCFAGSYTLYTYALLYLSVTVRFKHLLSKHVFRPKPFAKLVTSV